MKFRLYFNTGKLKTHLFKALSIAILLLFSVYGIGQDSIPKRILFVGNSFTYFNNLPQVTAAMAASQGIDLYIRSSTSPGAKLKDHWESNNGIKTMELLEEGKWDYVVLNNYSLGPIKTPERFEKYSKKFIDLIRQKGAEPIFMMTWAYKSKPEMQDTLSLKYKELCAETNTEFVPAGELFAACRSAFPTIQLFYDDKHPSSVGTYLLGLSFYKYFTSNSPVKIPKNVTTIDANGEKLYLIIMKREQAKSLRTMVDKFEFKTLTETE